VLPPSRVSQDHPGHIALADINWLSAQCPEPGHFVVPLASTRLTSRYIRFLADFPSETCTNTRQDPASPSIRTSRARLVLLDVLPEGLLQKSATSRESLQSMMISRSVPAMPGRYLGART
jgi:hypothetical protein